MSMRFPMRAAVAILSGAGAGIIGFGIAWKLDERILFLDGGVGRDALFLGSTFAPGIATALLVFRAISRALIQSGHPARARVGVTATAIHRSPRWA